MRSSADGQRRGGGSNMKDGSAGHGARTRIGTSILMGAVAMLSSSFGGAAPLGLVCPDGMVSYWTFDEDSGVDVPDVVGDNHGTLYVGDGDDVDAKRVPGAVGQAILLDGVDDYVVVPDGPSLRFADHDRLTLEVWLRTTGTGTYQQLCAKYVEDGFEFRLMRSANTVQLWNGDYDDGWGDVALLAVATVNDGLWHHVVGVVDAEKGYIYIDGELTSWDWIRDKGGNPGGNITNFATNADMMIGKTMPAFNPHHFNGTLDEFAIYKRPLTADEVLEHYQNGLDGRGYCVFDPATAISDLVGLVQSLNIDKKDWKKALQKTLAKARRALDQGRPKKAIKKLKKSIKKVKKAARKENLSEEDAAMLVAAARQIIDVLKG